MNDNEEKKYFRGWAYATEGDYHRDLDPNCFYTPTYLKKMKYVQNFLNTLPKDVRILDVGCGEGIIVEEYRKRGYDISGIDLNYESEYVSLGNTLDLPYADNSFGVVLMLDVFEHLSFKDQPKALSEIKRVLRPKGNLLISIPNLAHLCCRFRLFFQGQLFRTGSELDHQGERPMKENVRLLRGAGFRILKTKGVTLTLPIIYRIICHWPARFRWLHDILDIFALPSISFLNIFLCENDK